MGTRDNGKWHRKRHRIGNKARWRCFYCGAQVACIKCNPDITTDEMATLDHYMPKSKGGGREYENLVLACSPCNGAKGDQILTPVEIPAGLTYSIGALL